MPDLTRETRKLKQYVKTLSKSAKEADTVTKDRLNAIDAAETYCRTLFTDFGSVAGHFTSHGPDHSARVLAHSMSLAKLLKKRNPLNCHETFTLGVAAILHDIGMTAELPPRILRECCTEHDRWLERRKRHAEATAEILRRANADALRVIRAADQRAYDIFLPDICAAHSTSGFTQYIPLLRSKHRQALGHRYCTISGILLLADELDAARDRAASHRAHYNEFQSNVTKAHWWKHWLVSSVRLDGNVVRIVYLPDSKQQYATIFSEWTRRKIETQLQMLRRELDSDNTSPLWSIAVLCDPDDTDSLPPHTPPLNVEVVQAAGNELASVDRHYAVELVDASRMLSRVSDPDQQRNPSAFYRKAIEPDVSYFRGQGQHVSPNRAAELYVETDNNKTLMDAILGEFQTHANGPRGGSVLRVLCGDVGVGKTHFLSVAINNIKNRYPDIYQRTLLVRAELTHCDNDLADVMRRVAKAAFLELQRLGVAELLHNEMNVENPRKFSVIPSALEDIDAWDIGDARTFLDTIGTLCRGNSPQRAEHSYPTNMCIFLDNSDQLRPSIVADVYSWCYNFSGKSQSLLWVFFRPSTYARLQEMRDAPGADHYTLRPPETIEPASMQEVIRLRVQEFASKLHDRRVELLLSNHMTLQPIDVQDSLKYISELAIHTARDMLPQLANMGGGGLRTKSANIRVGLDGLVSILGSHIMTDDVYAEAIVLRRTQQDSPVRPEFGRWPRVLEALILGRRVWHRTDCSPVENLLDPPSLEANSEYFRLIHCLQILSANGRMELQTLMTLAGRLGYDRCAIRDTIQDAATRRVCTDDSFDLYERSCPLILICGDEIRPIDIPYPDNTVIELSPWGRYHLEILLYQAQYWKHIHYGVLLPRSLTSTLHLDFTEHEHLLENLQAVMEYLTEQEERSLSINSTLPNGVRYVMPKAKRTVFWQLRARR